MSDDRIAKLRQNAEQNPNDELANFSLGSALLDANQPGEAARSFQRVLAVNSQNSKAYQLLATAQRAAGDVKFAAETLATGYRIAHKRGDLMPANAMADMLREMGQPVPDLAAGKAAGDSSARASGAVAAGFACKRCGSPGPKLASRPFKGPLGERIGAEICQSCWREWVAMGTKVINELRLPMHDPQAQEMYDKHMLEFLGLEA